MMRGARTGLVLGLLALGCGGSPQEAESPASGASAPAADDSATTVEASPATAKQGEEAWEGEKEATKPAAGDEAAGRAAPPDTKGEETRTQEVIGKIIRDNRKPVRDCYDKAKKDLPTLAGDMVIFILLDPEGKVKKAELNQERSTLKSAAVVDCAIGVIKGLSFPPSSRGMETTVNYPYNFKP